MELRENESLKEKEAYPLTYSLWFTGNLSNATRTQRTTTEKTMDVYFTFEFRNYIDLFRPPSALNPFSN